MNTKEFEEYEFKNTHQRVKIKYMRDSDERLNPWEITNFVSRVSTYIYKIELLNTIAMAINQGIETKDIFILDKAYKLNGNYRNFSSINLNTLAINNVYAIGKPVSMAPNQDIMEVSFLFEILYNINKILYQSGKRRITKIDRLDMYHIMRREGFINALQVLCEISRKKVDEKERLKADKKIESEREKILKKYQDYLLDHEQFSSMQIKLDKKSVKDFTVAEQKLEKKYFKKFYEYLFKLPRPVVGIYYKQESKFIILCGDHFDSAIDRHTKIDLKSVTQNSPIMAEIEAGCQILALNKDEQRKKEIHEMEKRKRELEIAILEKENNIKEQEIMKNDFNILNEVLKLKVQMDSMAETEENLGLKKMVSSYAKDQLYLVSNKVQNGYGEVLATNKFKEESKTIIDIKV